MKIKKVLIWVLGVVLLVFALLLATPFVFKDKMQDLVVKAINKNIKASVSFEEVDVSLIKNFPRASVSIQDLTLVTKEPFLGDTLMRVSDLGLKMSIMELFKSDSTPMELESITVQGALVNIVVNKQGQANYDIALPDQTQDEQHSESEPFSLTLKNYALKDVTINYIDQGSDMVFQVKEFAHSGSGDFSENILDLDTQTSGILSLELDQVNFLNQVKLELQAVIGMDLNTNTYTFKDNQALINQLPLLFNGSVQLLETGQQIDLDFATPDSSFKNFLGLVPQSYSGAISEVQTTGEFKIQGHLKGMYSDTTIPKINIEMESKQASFKYPDLPKSVTNIVLDAKIVNQTGLIQDTYVDLDKLSFEIDKDVFHASAQINNITENPNVQAALKGVINLANLTQAYPVTLDKPLTGIFKADVRTSFDMESIKANKYEKVQNSGMIHLSGFEYESQDMVGPLEIQQVELNFNPSVVVLNKLDIKTGTSDLSATGRLDNFYGFLFNKQNLKGTFDLKSTNLVVSDLLKADLPNPDSAASTKVETQSKSEPLNIPSFLDCTIHASANRVLYDNLELHQVVGTMVIKDQTAVLKNMSTAVFDGKITFDGTVSTKQGQPDFSMDLGLNALDIAKAFQTLDMLKAIAPVAGVLQGKITSTLKLQGKLDAQTMSPDLNTLTGDMLGQLLSAKINPQGSKLLNTLTQELKFIDLSKVNLNNLKAHLKFEHGHVQIEPFPIKYQDVSVLVGGQHGFDQSMDYTLDLKVPVKYLGSEVTGLLSKLSAAEVDKLAAIPLKVDVTGNFAQPKIRTDLSQVTKAVADQIIEQQKNKLLDKGKGALEDLLTGGKKKPEQDQDPENASDQPQDIKEQVKDKVNQGLKDLFGKKK